MLDKHKGYHCYLLILILTTNSVPRIYYTIYITCYSV